MISATAITMRGFTNLLLLLLLSIPGVFGKRLYAETGAANSPVPKFYNVIWDSLSPDAWESMPLSGRMGAGANVWVQDGSLWLYLAHNEAYDEDGRLLKLGALRVTPANGVLTDSASFKQELDLTTGAITVSAALKNGQSIRFKLWFAGENLVIESASLTNTALDLNFGSWRDVTRDGMFIDMGKRQHTLRADHVNMDAKGLVWHHRNADYPSALAEELKAQPYAVGNLCNPTENNVFGGAIVCD